MAIAPIPEYEGKSPYVFISYAQQDEKIAYAIAVKMYNEGFRLWSSAACANPSTIRISERLSNCAVAMVFLSKSYLRFASDKEFEPRAVMNSPKQKIVVCLDDTPLGTDWNTVDFPAGIRYNPDVPQGLWLRINSSDALEKCRGAWPKRPMPEPYDEKPNVNISVDEEELSDELNSLNSVMSSFGAGLDDDEINNISLFRRKDPDQDRFRWPEKCEPSQEQEYYSIENLIDNSPTVISPEKRQYDNMIGLIESFMEKSSRVREEEQERRLQQEADDRFKAKMPVSQNTYREYHAVPKNEFGSVDLSKDTSSAPVVITESSAPQPVTLDYGEESDIPAYSMTRNAGRAERVSEIVYTPPAPRAEPSDGSASHQEKPALPQPEKKEANRREEPLFEKIVDSRKLLQSTDDNIDGAKLTYHLGSLFDGFDENDFAQGDDRPKPEEPRQEPPKPEKKPEPEVKLPPVKTEDDIPKPTLSFEKPARPVTENELIPEPPQKRRMLSKPKRRYIVSVRRGVRHIEYDDEMYEVNGRWIPGNIYHRLMPNARYTAVRHINRTVAPEPEKPQVLPDPPAAVRNVDSRLSSDSRLHSAVNTFFTPSRRGAGSAESISEELRSALREKHEIRRSEGIRQYQESLAASQPSSASNHQASQKNQAAAGEGENAPARKHKFSHEGGIKKSLLANMDTPVNTDVEESHRQHGARAAAAAEAAASAVKETEGKKSKKKDDKAAKKAAKKAAEKAAQKKAESKKGDKKGKNKKPPEEETSSEPLPTAPSAFPDVDDDSLIEMPSKNLPNLHYDPSAYSSMNLSEILFGERGGQKGDAKSESKEQKKKKKK